MTDESELFTGANIRSHLRALQAQINLMKSYLDEYGESNRNLRRQITQELVTAVIVRFEKNEGIIKNLNEKIDSLNFEIRERLSQEIKSIRDEISVVQKNEERISSLEEKMDSMQFEIKERIPHEFRSIRDEISGAQLSKAITSISEEKEIKVNSKPLDELNKEQELFF